jgi:hypothetical protein
VIVRTAIQDHGYRWTWILVGLLVLYGAGTLLTNWRRGPVATAPEAQRRETGAKGQTKAPNEPTAIDFRRGMLLRLGAVGAALTVVCGWGAFIVFSDPPQSDWLGIIVGACMVMGFGLFLWWVVFAARGLLGRPALILDADGLTDQSSPIPLGRVAWDDIEAIHWQWPGQLLATRQIVAVDRRSYSSGSIWSTIQLVPKWLRSRGLDTAKLAVSDEELAHQFRRYSGGRFGIRQQQ